MIKFDLNFNVLKGKGKVGCIQSEYNLMVMRGLAFTAASSVRKAANTGNVTSRSTILIMEISPNFLSPLIIFLCSVLHWV